VVPGYRYWGSSWRCHSMFDLIAVCLPFLKATTPGHQIPSLYTRFKPIAVESCTFCHVCTQNGFNVVWETEGFIAFHDRSPAARYHFQVIPKTHIVSVKELRTSDAALVRTMEEIGHKLLDDLDVPPLMRRMGFHIPPYNSLDHLHLHVQGLPYKSLARASKYPITHGWCRYHKGPSWFVEVGQAIRILENGSTIGVLPC